MGNRKIKTGDTYNTLVEEWFVDTKSEFDSAISTSEMLNAPAGSTAYVADTSNFYIKNTQGNWCLLAHPVIPETTEETNSEET